MQKEERSHSSPRVIGFHRGITDDKLGLKSGKESLAMQKRLSAQGFLRCRMTLISSGTGWGGLVQPEKNAWTAHRRDAKVLEQEIPMQERRREKS